MKFDNFIIKLSNYNMSFNKLHKHINDITNGKKISYTEAYTNIYRLISTHSSKTVFNYINNNVIIPGKIYDSKTKELINCITVYLKYNNENYEIFTS
jgi:hypothetical protein